MYRFGSLVQVVCVGVSLTGTAIAWDAAIAKNPPPPQAPEQIGQIVSRHDDCIVNSSEYIPLGRRHCSLFAEKIMI